MWCDSNTSKVLSVVLWILAPDDLNLLLRARQTTALSNLFGKFSKKSWVAADSRFLCVQIWSLPPVGSLCTNFSMSSLSVCEGWHSICVPLVYKLSYTENSSELNYSERRHDHLAALLSGVVLPVRQGPGVEPELHGPWQALHSFCRDRGTILRLGGPRLGQESYWLLQWDGQDIPAGRSKEPWHVCQGRKLLFHSLSRLSFLDNSHDQWGGRQ